MKIRIYLVDDEPSICEMVQMVLVSAGIDVTTETSSAKAAARIPKEKFDAVFLDIRMPEPDGLQLARIQRAGGFNQRSPIVMITGDDDPTVLRQGYEAGGNFFLFKPFDRRGLLRMVRASQDFIEREKRRFQRVPMRIPITIESKDSKIEAMTVDMSLNGMLAETSRVLPDGTPVELSILLPEAKAPLKIKARVLRVIGKDRLAILYQGMSPADSGALHQFMLPLILSEMGGEAT